MTSKERADLYERDPMHAAFSKLNVEYWPEERRPHVLVVRMARREDAVALQERVQDWLSTKEDRSR